MSRAQKVNYIHYKHCRIFLISISVIAAFLLTGGCGSSRMMTQGNNPSYYKESGALHPKYTIHHINKEFTQLHFQINSAELLATKQPGETNFTCHYSVSYLLKYATDTRTILDSATIRLNDVLTNTPHDIVGSINIKTKEMGNYILEVYLTDLNKNQYTRRILYLAKENDSSAQNFFVRSAVTQLPLFGNHLSPNEEVVISNRVKAYKFFVRYYKYEFPIASNPHVVYPYKPLALTPDSIFSLTVNDSNSVHFKVKTRGIYLFQTDTSRLQGLALFYFYPEFPEIKTVDQLVYPLRYLLRTRQAYEDIVTAKNKKEAVDNFWVNCAGSQERARELIRKFYNRVEHANIAYTSLMEGWKSDRGMIYIVYGQPTSVRKGIDSELWTYGEDGNPMSITFQFTKAINPFSDNYYILERSSLFQTSWNLQLDMWEMGKIFSDN